MQAHSTRLPLLIQSGLRVRRSAPSSPGFHAAARGGALFLGLFTLVGLAATLRSPGFDPNLWWLDLRALPNSAAMLLRLLLGGLLTVWAVRPQAGKCRQTLTRMFTGMGLFILLVNTVCVLALFLSGRVESGFPIPATAVFALLLGLVYREVQTPAPTSADLPALAVTVLACGLLFPLLQILCFGRTDYRRPADVAVVFGARVYADGRLSDAVGDRVATAAELYRQGWVRELVMSGGPGDGAIHETTAMKAAAVRAGVPASAIWCDLEGLSTAATVHNTAPTFTGQRILAVSEYYHLPRIKLAYARAGLDVFTVPAEARNWRRAWDLRSVLREVPAFWLYHFRSVFLG
jgi:uncharacterized SAM-binding protein YcdF (DUF218 family)